MHKVIQSTEQRFTSLSLHYFMLGLSTFLVYSPKLNHESWTYWLQFEISLCSLYQSQENMLEPAFLRNLWKLQSFRSFVTAHGYIATVQGYIRRNNMLYCYCTPETHEPGCYAMELFFVYAELSAGRAERMVGILKKALKKMVKYEFLNWDDALTCVFHDCRKWRSSIKGSTSSSCLHILPELQPLTKN